MQSLSAQQIASLLGGRLFGPSTESEIRGVAFDSRAVRPGDVFVAVKGTKTDGHDFIATAMSHGAGLAVVSEESRADGHAGILVTDTRRALSRLAAHFTGNPSEKMKVIGITGTNGKTTTNWILYHVLNALNLPSVRFGTLGVRAEGLLDRPGNLTTPDPILIHTDLRTALNGGVRSAVFETSSHALDQCRVDDVFFDVGVFTNLTRDHLDYHVTMEAYYASKKKLFELIAEGPKQTRAAVINLDDDFGMRLQGEIAELKLNDFSFGRHSKARVRLTGFHQSTRGSESQIYFAGKRYEIQSRLIGEHNAQNLCAVFASALAFGLAPDFIIKAIATAPQVPGRLESVGQAPFAVFVDYAHSPDALENVLKSLRPLTRNKLRVIFGCGGDRDRGKRPQMATIAAAGADSVIVTSDNPRTEDPNAIIQEILSSGVRADLVEADREKAIEATLRECGPGDVVLLAGKGHEDYQIIGKEKIYFSDQETTKKILGNLGY